LKENKNIPASKVERAARFLKTGVKVGSNYIKHYAKKAIDSDHTREELDKANADEIYESLGQLKGSALKLAQMMSMDKNILPQAYIDKFTKAQYSAPPLSYPLVVKTFRQSFGKSPEEIFDTFSREAVNAASIGQVHQATIKGKKYAVKVQYPGVADSVKSDLRMVKPIASQVMQMKGKDLEQYFDEVELRLLEETDYELEVKRSIELTGLCANLQNVYFTAYYPELSSDRIITMDWIEGLHLKDFLLTDPSQEIRNQIGQALWDFYSFQIHQLKQVHADPHPGNFLMRNDGTLGVLDFGCIKIIPQEFYKSYVRIFDPSLLQNEEEMKKVLMELDFLKETDSPEDRTFYMEVFRDLLGLMCLPFHREKFDFGDDAYFKKIYQVGESLSKSKELRKGGARGSKHGIYLNRTFFGLYNLLNELKAEVITSK
jgi:predicted unusual protein kinase regulating ubiquinone biosynthesis (AarF/ABC1/UbiB family)